MFLSVALLSAIASLNLCSVFPPPVFITSAIFLESKTSTMWGEPLLTLLIILHLILYFLKYSAVPFVAHKVKLNLISSLAKSIPSSLWESFNDTNASPCYVNELPPQIWHLSKPNPNYLTNPNTSHL